MKVLGAAFLMVVAAASVTPLLADVTITPAAADTNDVIAIRLANQFGAEARVLGASVRQSGTTFHIDQHVLFACFAPSNPTVASEFQVGPLPPGTYVVVANIVFDPAPSQCARPPVVQTATFAITGPSIPTLDMNGLLLVAVSIAIAAVIVLKTRSN